MHDHSKLPTQFISKMLMLSGMALLGASLFGFAGGFIAQYFYSIGDLKLFIQSPELQSNQPSAALLIQAMASFGTFVIPSLIFALYFTKLRLSIYFTLQKKPAILPLIILFFLAFLVNPVADLAFQLNQLLHLPDTWGYVAQWINAQNEKITNNYSALLSFHSIGQFSLAMLSMALVPAIGEELFFRGILQRLIQNQTGRSHAGIWITALLFSLIHLQLSLFLPRLVLGAFIGYLFWWSGRLWYAIAAHFINNALALSIYYCFPNFADTNNAGISANWIFMIIGLILFMVFLYLFHTFVTQSAIKHGKGLG